jgi:predicted CoA-substrate-specific enzyme activase
MDKAVYTMGVDIGSTSSKCVILKNGISVIGQAVAASGTGTTGPSRAVTEAFAQAALEPEQIAITVATGYGRNSYKGCQYTFSEMSCHAKGARFLSPEARTVIDIGGQDAKALRLLPNGQMDNFVMNDKCAAGTGRFLDVMARVIESDVSQLAQLDAMADSVVNISSTCTVFAESEVISQLAQNVSLPNLVAGIHRSVATRTSSLVKRLGVEEPVVMTGGVARNAGVIRALEEQLGVTVKPLENAQTVGALGAALFAWEKYLKSNCNSLAV